MMKSALRPTAGDVPNPETFQIKLGNYFKVMRIDATIDHTNNKLVKIHTVRFKYYKI